ncbi:MAG: 5-oxoprolinase subunit PxpB [Gemmatimonadaceae bacterium]|nr:5-oxoprolinase subunit PxpB [Gemmatimonadaceae bacterium]
MSDPRIIPLGESAFIIRLSDQLDRAANTRARALADAIDVMSLPGITDVVPANCSVGVYFENPANAAELEQTLAGVLRAEAPGNPAAESITHEVPVNYNGPDLPGVAEVCGLPVSRVIEIHSSVEYQVFAIGFAPGFAYMGEVDERISVPRRGQPRTRVPAGSVAIANRQTAVYPFETPGGWNLLGTTSVLPFDIGREPAALFRVGDRVRFRPS